MNIPQHIAIIMDGNGRWAKAQGKPRNYGHLKGTENVRNIAIKADELGVRVLTLYAFSTENWKRPDEEVGYLMSLPAVFFKKFMAELMEKGVRIETIGNLDVIPEATRKVIEDARRQTAENKGLTLVFALNYGSRAEIVRAANLAAAQCDGQITEEDIERNLYTAGYPDIDLMIRTSLDYRLSNFLLWQLSYAELYFTDVYWPDFDAEQLEKAIEWFNNRERRFGGLV
ncbi:MAG: isoprenyl transferase [Erysipelotrichaceae bacterium]|nr:isoprenyl transferase [Erysipelotrichaceae bacterium]